MSPPISNRPKSYAIKIEERLEPGWSDWFDGFSMEEFEGYTELRGQINDQAALHGMLIKIRDLGLTLLAVEQLIGQ